MEKTSKQPPVDRGKLLIALECCRNGACDFCPDRSFMEMVTGCSQLADNSLAYIGYLEEQLEEAGHRDA